MRVSSEAKLHKSLFGSRPGAAPFRPCAPQPKATAFLPASLVMSSISLSDFDRRSGAILQQCTPPLPPLGVQAFAFAGYRSVLVGSEDSLLTQSHLVLPVEISVCVDPRTRPDVHHAQVGAGRGEPTTMRPYRDPAGARARCRLQSVDTLVLETSFCGPAVEDTAPGGGGRTIQRQLRYLSFRRHRWARRACLGRAWPRRRQAERIPLDRDVRPFPDVGAGAMVRTRRAASPTDAPPGPRGARASGRSPARSDPPESRSETPILWLCERSSCGRRRSPLPRSALPLRLPFCLTFQPRNEGAERRTGRSFESACEVDHTQHVAERLLAGGPDGHAGMCAGQF